MPLFRINWRTQPDEYSKLKKRLKQLISVIERYKTSITLDLILQFTDSFHEIKKDIKRLPLPDQRKFEKRIENFIEEYGDYLIEKYEVFSPNALANRKKFARSTDQADVGLENQFEKLSTDVKMEQQGKSDLADIAFEDETQRSKQLELKRQKNKSDNIPQVHSCGSSNTTSPNTSSKIPRPIVTSGQSRQPKQEPISDVLRRMKLEQNGGRTVSNVQCTKEEQKGEIDAKLMKDMDTVNSFICADKKQMEMRKELNKKPQNEYSTRLNNGDEGNEIVLKATADRMRNQKYESIKENESNRRETDQRYRNQQGCRGYSQHFHHLQNATEKEHTRRRSLQEHANVEDKIENANAVFDRNRQSQQKMENELYENQCELGEMYENTVKCEEHYRDQSFRSYNKKNYDRQHSTEKDHTYRSLQARSRVEDNNFFQDKACKERQETNKMYDRNHQYGSKLREIPNEKTLQHEQNYRRSQQFNSLSSTTDKRRSLQERGATEDTYSFPYKSYQSQVRGRAKALNRSHYQRSYQLPERDILPQVTYENESKQVTKEEPINFKDTELAEEAVEEKPLEILDVHQYFSDDYNLKSLEPLEITDQIAQIKTWAQTFETKVSQFSDSKCSIEFFVLDEKLMRLIEHLDKLKCRDDQTVTKQKIEVIHYIKGLLSVLDSRVTED